MIENGRLEMAHQTAARFFGRTSYEEEFGGFALDESEGERIAGQGKNRCEHRFSCQSWRYGWRSVRGSSL